MYLVENRTDEARAVLENALGEIEQQGERTKEAELYRLMGELVLQSDNPSADLQAKEAETYFRKALDVAQRQKAKSLELPAATSLARLWKQQGKSTEAHELLSEIYDWFTEGFDTRDLQEAKVLLEELG